MQPYTRPWRLKIMTFCQEHPKRDQNLTFTPISETMSIPVAFKWEFTPPPGNTTTLRTVICSEGDHSSYKLCLFESSSLKNLNLKRFQILLNVFLINSAQFYMFLYLFQTIKARTETIAEQFNFDMQYALSAVIVHDSQSTAKYIL